jgi:hypothetical protein
MKQKEEKEIKEMKEQIEKLTIESNKTKQEFITIAKQIQELHYTRKRLIQIVQLPKKK